MLHRRGKPEEKNKDNASSAGEVKRQKVMDGAGTATRLIKGKKTKMKRVETENSEY